MARFRMIPAGTWCPKAHEHPAGVQGTLTYPPPPVVDDEEEKPGAVYVGNLVEGVRNGRGKYIWSNGCFYDGQYEDGNKCGTGTMTFPGGGQYAGEHLQGLSLCHPHSA